MTEDIKTPDVAPSQAGDGNPVGDFATTVVMKTEVTGTEISMFDVESQEDYMKWLELKVHQLAEANMNGGALDNLVMQAHITKSKLPDMDTLTVDDIFDDILGVASANGIDIPADVVTKIRNKFELAASGVDVDSDPVDAADTTDTVVLDSDQN
jgi:hypothetical protein